MIILSTINRKLEVVLGGATTNPLPFVVSYVDHTATTYTPDSSNGQTNGATPVDLVAAPGASTQRHVKSIFLRNSDVAAVTATVRYNDNATTRVMWSGSLAVGDTLQFNDGEGWTVLDTLGALKVTTSAPGRLLRTPQVLTASSGTYTTPAGCSAITVEVVGGGGGGGGCSSLASNAAVGGGGAAGGYAIKTIQAPAASYAYVCGAFGVGGANTGATGGTGLDTTWGGAVVVGKGGLGGVGMVYGTTPLTALGGAGVIPTGGDLNQAGACGANAVRQSGTIAVSGAGGNSPYGGGGAAKNAQSAGVAASGWGGGGGGGCALSAAVVGGNGTAGVIMVWEYS